MNPRLFMLAALGLTAAGCAAKAQLTESQEYFVGRGVSANVMAGSPLNEDRALEEYVSNVGQTIALESDRPETFKGYSFAVLQDPGINAFAAPGGFIFVTTGMLQAMQGEDELAGVLAHEIAHVNLRHPEHAALAASRRAGALELLEGAAKLADLFYAMKGREKARERVKDLAGAFSKVLDELTQEIVNGYGRESELKADALAVDFLVREGVRYDPEALKAFISRLPAGDRGSYSTHPTLEGRTQLIGEEIRKRGVAVPADPARTRRFQAMTAGLRGP